MQHRRNTEIILIAEYRILPVLYALLTELNSALYIGTQVYSTDCLRKPKSRHSSTSSVAKIKMCLSAYVYIHTEERGVETNAELANKVTGFRRGCFLEFREELAGS